MGSYFSTPVMETILMENSLMEKSLMEDSLMEDSLILVENPNIPEPAEIAEIIQTEPAEIAEIIQTKPAEIAEIIQTENYIINGITYIYAFPKVWAQNHLSDTGPESCLLCFSNGIVNDIFVGYCHICASFYHDYERGLGFINNDYDEATVDVDYLGNSAFLTYLKDVELPYDYSDMPELIEL
jgi:hypothetical protein